MTKMEFDVKDDTMECLNSFMNRNPQFSLHEVIDDILKIGVVVIGTRDSVCPACKERIVERVGFNWGFIKWYKDSVGDENDYE